MTDVKVARPIKVGATHDILYKREGVTGIVVHNMSNRFLMLNTVKNPAVVDNTTVSKDVLVRALPSSYTLMSKMPPVYDQGDLGSCVANATAALLSYANFVSVKKVQFMGSRLFMYFNGRGLDGIYDEDPSELTEDVGLYLDSALLSIKTYGVLAESGYPYNISRFAYLPSSATYQSAQKNKAVTYTSVAKTTLGLRTRLSQGYPIMFGILIYENFFDDAVTATGVVPMPSGELLGGHALVLIGYNDSTSRYIFRNSWGTSWGAAGYGTIPYAYLTSDDAFQPLSVSTFTAS